MSSISIGTGERRVTEPMRFSRDDSERERFLVSISKRPRFLSVTPASMATRTQTMLAIVRASGSATHANLPAPIVCLVVDFLAELRRG